MSDARKKDRTLLLLAAGSLGFLLALSLVVLAVNPDLRRQLRERLESGTVSQGGVLMQLERGKADGGRRLELSFKNVGGSHCALGMPTSGLASSEVSVSVEDARGVSVPCIVIPPDVASVESWSIVGLEPGDTRRLVVDLDRFVKLPGPGHYEIVVDRARLSEGEPRLRSNKLAIDVR